MIKRFTFALLAGFLFLISCNNKTEKAEDFYREGIRALEKNQYEEALQAFNEAIKYNDEDPRFYYYRGNVYLNQNNFQKAIANYEKAIASDSTYYDAWANKGTAIFYQSGDKDKACPYWVKAQNLGKENMRNKVKGCAAAERPALSTH
ncbi:MAG: tetratricopeptide repeat protein [Bacteroidales bacterium]